MKIVLSFMLALTLLDAKAVHITHYTAHRPLCYDHTAILRTFDRDGQHMQLTVDVKTLHTSIQPAAAPGGHPCAPSHYTRLLAKAVSAPWPLTNDGITHQHGGMTLTTDLCPSSKRGFERRLYRTLIDRFPHPVPVTLFVSGRWIAHHEKALSQLRRWEHEGKLAITWGNHTYTHPYHPGRPLKRNFVLSPGYDLQADTLKLEQTLLEHGITPSIFFRFPGLVSDKKSIETIQGLGLIPIGSDAWLAKGQQPTEGSIILVHGNKNEPKGVDMFLKMIKTLQSCPILFHIGRDCKRTHTL